MRKKKTSTGASDLVDVGRAAEILGYSYNAIIKAIESDSLKAYQRVERKGGGKSPLIRKCDLESYRLTLVKRYQTMPQKSARLADLQKRKVLKT